MIMTFRIELPYFTISEVAVMSVISSINIAKVTAVRSISLFYIALRRATFS
jgi:hypothetical protein